MARGRRIRRPACGARGYASQRLADYLAPPQTKALHPNRLPIFSVAGPGEIPVGLRLEISREIPGWAADPWLFPGLDLAWHPF